MGLIMSVVFVAAAESFAASFVPREVRQSSLNYVRVSAPVALSSAIQVAVSSCTRALDQPDVPLLISSTGVICNIVLDLLIISKFHVGSFQPTILMQAGIRLACDMTAAFVGLGYFFYLATKILRQHQDAEEPVRPNIKALVVLGRPAIYTFIESLIRNVIYLWLVSTIIGLGQDYATAWGVFNTIRWGLIMVPVQALQASTLTFVGHKWGKWHAQKGVNERKPAATWKDVKTITGPAFLSTLISIGIEVPVCIFLSLWGMKEFAYYISASDDVARITRDMWRKIDWCYIFYAMDYQLAAILLATVPRWYLYQALGSNFLWMLPWAIVVTKVKWEQAEAWKFYAIIFGGSLVFSFFNVALVLVLWVWRLMDGKMRLQPVTPRIS
jgi:Na+-driven multidrug efflux pump